MFETKFNGINWECPVCHKEVEMVSSCPYCGVRLHNNRRRAFLEERKKDGLKPWEFDFLRKEFGSLLHKSYIRYKGLGPDEISFRHFRWWDGTRKTRWIDSKGCYTKDALKRIYDSMVGITPDEVDHKIGNWVLKPNTFYTWEWENFQLVYSPAGEFIHIIIDYPESPLDTSYKDVHHHIEEMFKKIREKKLDRLHNSSDSGPL